MAARAACWCRGRFGGLSLLLQHRLNLPQLSPDIRRKLQSRSASVEFQPVDEPRLLTRAYRFTSVLLLAARIYSRYKAIQLWSRYFGQDRKEQRYRRQDLRAAQALYAASIRLEGLLIKACQFIAT